MKTYHVAVIEDQKQDFLNTKACLDRFSAEKGIGFRLTTFTNAENFLNNYTAAYDVVFMDIMLPGINGMDAAKRLRQYDPKVLLIFLTNMDAFAIQGYEVDAIGYVMKPVSYYNLAMHLNNAVKRIDTSDDISVPIRSQEGTRILFSRDIYYIDIIDHNMVFHTANGDISAYGTLNEREKELADAGFARCSAWALVNLRYVEAIFKEEIIVAGEHIRISRIKKKDFLNAFSAFLGRR